MQLSLIPSASPAPADGPQKRGIVYTQAWVVEFILDLAGYRADADLVGAIAVEPAAGDGAFVTAMVRRLVASCRRQQLPLSAIGRSLRAYEIHVEAAAKLEGTLTVELIELGAMPVEAASLAQGWVLQGDYLLEWIQTPVADFVIGNPPYIRLEDVPAEIAQTYRRLYATMIGRADIYVAFFEAALKQLRPNGVCALICADRWMLNQYGAELRRFITGRYSVEVIVEMHDADAFDTQVSAYPAVTVIRNAKQGSVLVARANAAAGPGEQLADQLLLAASTGTTAPPSGFRASRLDGWFHGDEPWPNLPPERLALLKRLEDQFGSLGDATNSTRVGIGVATGADDVFITRNPNLIEQSRLLPLAMAADTRSGTLAWSGHYLVNPWEHDGRLVDLALYPRLRAYVEEHRAALADRHTARRNPQGWYRTIDRVHSTLTSRPKLYLPDIKGNIHPVLDRGVTYPHHNLYVVYSDTWDIEVLGGLLLSSVAQFFVECYGVRMRGGWLRFQAQYLRHIRLPAPEMLAAAVSEQLRCAFRTRDLELANAVAFRLYGIDGLPGE